VFGLATSQLFTSAANLYTINVDGTDKAQLTHDGRSFYPVWGASGIVYDHFKLRGNNAPAYQLYVLNGGHTRQITHSHPGLVVDGLVPLSLSSSGNQLMASYEGTDTDEAYTVNIKTGAVHRLTDKNVYVSAAAISRNGKRALVDLGGFEGPPGAGSIGTIPFAGGKTTVLVKHAGTPSWDQ
jgi:hypothetical protein